MAKIKVTKVRSAINRPQNQKRTLEALGLKKMGQVKEHENTPNILGMIRKGKHNRVSADECLGNTLAAVFGDLSDTAFYDCAHVISFVVVISAIYPIW
jgi:large subunit ribosomal protein L30